MMVTLNLTMEAEVTEAKVVDSSDSPLAALMQHVATLIEIRGVDIFIYTTAPPCPSQTYKYLIYMVIFSKLSSDTKVPR